MVVRTSIGSTDLFDWELTNGILGRFLVFICGYGLGNIGASWPSGGRRGLVLPFAFFLDGVLSFEPHRRSHLFFRHVLGNYRPVGF